MGDPKRVAFLCFGRNVKLIMDIRSQKLDTRYFVLNTLYLIPET